MSAPDAEPRREAPDAEAQHDANGGGAARPDAMSRGYARSRDRADAIRAQLQPLGPGERPLGLKLAVALALFIAAANLVGAAAGVGSESPAVGVVFALLMCLLAAGMWARKYLVLLLFQALLAVSIIISALSLAFARDLLGALVAVVVIAACAPVFWLLIRVMARLQVPRG